MHSWDHPSHRLGGSPLGLGARQSCVLVPLLCCAVLDILASSVSKRKTLCFQTEKEKVKLSLFTNNMTLHVENSKESNQKRETERERNQRINELKLQNIRQISANQLYFYVLQQ